MSSGRNFEKAKRRALGRHGQPLDHPGRFRTSLRGWRTEYPEEFPVTVTKIKPKDKAA